MLQDLKCRFTPTLILTSCALLSCDLKFETRLMLTLTYIESVLWCVPAGHDEKLLKSSADQVYSDPGNVLR